MNDIFIFNDIDYEILLCESDAIFIPEYFGILPIWSDDADFQYQSTFILKDYQLYLKSFITNFDLECPKINGIKPEPYLSFNDREAVQFNDLMEPLKFTGAIVLANQLIKDYGYVDATPCFSYKNVSELIFHEGKLVTAINHSRDMKRIRKNIEMGLRRLDKKQDVKCIQHFLKNSLVGDYNCINKAKLKKPISKLKKPNLNLIKTVHNFIKKDSVKKDSL